MYKSAIPEVRAFFFKSHHLCEHGLSFFLDLIPSTARCQLRANKILFTEILLVHELGLSLHHPEQR